MLTDAAIRKRCRPGPKPYKVTDRDGLYAVVTPAGSIWWRFDYSLAGKRKTLSMGTYPDVTLAKARTRTLDADMTSVVKFIEIFE